MRTEAAADRGRSRGHTPGTRQRIEPALERAWYSCTDVALRAVCLDIAFAIASAFLTRCRISLASSCACCSDRARSLSALRKRSDRSTTTPPKSTKAIRLAAGRTSKRRPSWLPPQLVPAATRVSATAVTPAQEPPQIEASKTAGKKVTNGICPARSGSRGQRRTAAASTQRGRSLAHARRARAW